MVNTLNYCFEVTQLSTGQTQTVAYATLSSVPTEFEVKKIIHRAFGCYAQGSLEVSRRGAAIVGDYTVYAN